MIFFHAWPGKLVKVFCLFHDTSPFPPIYSFEVVVVRDESCKVEVFLLNEHLKRLRYIK